MATKPLFARFLSRQDRLPAKTDEKAGAVTKKYPSDRDETIETLKYPSDNDEGGVDI